MGDTASSESVSAEQTPSAKRRGVQVSIGRRARCVISLLIALHLLAVVAEPLRFFTRSPRGTSPVADLPRRALAPYIDLGYLSHGYFFFAPEPGPSHLMQFTLEMPDGTTATIRYPDRRKQWPRLLYHRHFMLAENLNQLWVPPWQEADPPPARPILENWKRDRQRYEMVRDSYASHIAHRFGASRVSVDRIEHILPSDIQVFEERMRLQDKRLYVVQPDTLDAELVPPTSEAGELTAPLFESPASPALRPGGHGASTIPRETDNRRSRADSSPTSTGARDEPEGGAHE